LLLDADAGFATLLFCFGGGGKLFFAATVDAAAAAAEATATLGFAVGAASLLDCFDMELLLLLVDEELEVAKDE
jgi:hypothetical protein